MKANAFCIPCKRYSCPIQSHDTSARFRELLEHFQEPETSEMRTYHQPEKHKLIAHPNDVLPSRGGNFDRNDPALASLQSPFLRENNTRMMPNSSVTPSNNTAMVRIGRTENEYVRMHDALSTSTSTISKVKGSKPRELHHFTKVKAISFVSVSAPEGLYSETSFVLWIDNKSSSERRRIVIVMLFDRDEDLWNVSAKLMKRPLYYVKDEEESQVQNRLCFTSELRGEIKRMMLYLGVSPRDVYRLFRKQMSEDLVITDADYGFMTVESASHAQLSKELEKADTTTSYATTTGWEHRAHGANHLTREEQDERYKHAMMGGVYGMGECWD